MLRFIPTDWLVRELYRRNVIRVIHAHGRSSETASMTSVHAVGLLFMANCAHVGRTDDGMTCAVVAGLDLDYLPAEFVPDTFEEETHYLN